MLINRKFGDYILLRRLALGGQSEVFLALKTGPGDFSRTVVIKALPARLRREDEKYVQLFFKEAFVSSKFAHPNVVNVHDARLIEGEYCLIMDFIAGQTVSDIAQRAFKSGRPIEMTQAVQIIADACDGLHYAHRFRDLDDATYSIIHCDISPQNLMVTYQGVTKLFDFGIAQIPGYEDTNSSITIGGKFAYMSPEQLRAEEIDARSDLFSLGIILYELCTGYRLFRRGSQPEIIRAVTQEPIRMPTELRADIPIFLERCIMRALARDPAQRYAHAAAMRDELLQVLSMMSKGSERDELGNCVASLFVEEREMIASTIRQGHQWILNTPQPVDGLLEYLGQDEEVSDVTMELGTPGELSALNEHIRLKPQRIQGEVSMFLAKSEHLPRTDLYVEPQVQDAPGGVVQEESAKERALKKDLARLRRRQSGLMIFLCVVLAVTVGLIVLGAQIFSTAQKQGLTLHLPF